MEIAVMTKRRLEIDDAVRKQMNVRMIEETEINAVVNNPQQELLVRRRGRPIEGRWLYRGEPRPGRILEIECQIRADTGMYRVVRVIEI
jgi:hypothetical protein